MQAVYFNEHGDRDRLTYGELPDPEPAAHEVVVRVRFCGLNHADLWVRRGLPFLRVEMPFVLGQDVAGDIAAVGSAVSTSSVGDRVVLNPGHCCTRCEHCLGGNDHLCAKFVLMGKNLRGGYAQYVKVPAQNVVPLPDEVPYESAACLPAVFGTAWNMLFDQGRLKPGDWVLVQAGGSGVGSAAIQLAKLVGANIITTAGTDEKLEKAAALGAHHLINYKTQDMLREVRKATNKRGVDVIVEHVGQDIWETCVLCLATGGRLVTCGATTGFKAQTDLRHVFFRNLQIIGATAASKSVLFRTVELLREGKLAPAIDRVLPLKDAREAHRLLEERKQFGKVLLAPE
jgi:NADPH:quinone reductase-like Zn-dependent oxidoreductase